MVLCFITDRITRLSKSHFWMEGAGEKERRHRRQRDLPLEQLLQRTFWAREKHEEKRRNWRKTSNALKTSVWGFNGVPWVMIFLLLGRSLTSKFYLVYTEFVYSYGYRIFNFYLRLTTTINSSRKWSVCLFTLQMTPLVFVDRVSCFGGPCCPDDLAFCCEG